MTVKQLKEKIKDIPDNMDVFIRQTNDEYEYNMAITASAKKIKFSDERLVAHETCLVLSDE